MVDLSLETKLARQIKAGAVVLSPLFQSLTAADLAVRGIVALDLRDVGTKYWIKCRRHMSHGDFECVIFAGESGAISIDASGQTLAITGDFVRASIIDEPDFKPFFENAVKASLPVVTLIQIMDQSAVDPQGAMARWRKLRPTLESALIALTATE